MFLRAPPCPIGVFKCRSSSRCNNIIPVCQHFLLSGFTEWPNDLFARWHVIWDRFMLFLFWGLLCDNTICSAFSNFLYGRRPTETYKTLYTSVRLQTIYLVCRPTTDVPTTDKPQNFCFGALLRSPQPKIPKNARIVRFFRNNVLCKNASKTILVPPCFSRRVASNHIWYDPDRSILKFDLRSRSHGDQTWPEKVMFHMCRCVSTRQT